MKANWAMFQFEISCERKKTSGRSCSGRRAGEIVLYGDDVIEAWVEGVIAIAPVVLTFGNTVDAVHHGPAPFTIFTVIAKADCHCCDRDNAALRHARPGLGYDVEQLCEIPRLRKGDRLRQ